MDWLSGAKGKREFKALQMVKNLRHPNLVPITGLWLRDSNGNLRASLARPATENDTATSDPSVSASRSDSGSQSGDTSLDDDDQDSAAQLFIAMGVCEMTLSDVLQQRREAGRAGIPRAELLQYMEGAAAAIDYLHIDCSVIHRDVKPQNILLLAGRAQVGDFGLARQSTDLQSTISRGTRAYWAPEAGTKTESFSIDQFSLAISYAELRRGVLPYRDRESEKGVLVAKARGDFDLTGLSRAERRVVRKALSIDPRQRYKSCGEFVEQLQRAHVWKYAWIYSAAAVALIAISIASVIPPAPPPPPPAPADDPLPAIFRAQLDSHNLPAAIDTLGQIAGDRSEELNLLLESLDAREAKVIEAGKAEHNLEQDYLEVRKATEALADESPDLVAVVEPALEQLRRAGEAGRLRQAIPLQESDR